MIWVSFRQKKIESSGLLSQCSCFLGGLYTSNLKIKSFLQTAGLGKLKVVEA